MYTLLGASLCACKRILEYNNDSIYAFTRYTSSKECNTNSASAALNKWLKEKLLNDFLQLNTQVSEMSINRSFRLG